MTAPIQNKQKPVALIGMMGTGKSTLGQLLAKNLGLSFIDTDQIIVEQSNQSIPEIFETHGQAYFRTLEASIIKTALETNTNAIIATGGGAVTNPNTLDLLKNKTHLIWLQSTAEEIFKRIKHDKNRPLLHTENPLQTLQKLISDRQDLYAQAHFHIHVHEDNIQTTINDITKFIAQHANSE